MVERPWGVTAYGAASVRAVPDLVRARFQVSRTEQEASQAFAVVSDAVRGVRRVLREHGVPDGAVEQSQLGLVSSYSYGQERKFIGHACSASFSVEFTNLEGVQPLLVDLVAAGANEIEGVDFDVSGKPALRAEARRQAVAAARGKAELYAEAANVRLGAVLHIEDVDPEQIGEGHYRGHQADADAGEDFAPGHVVVSAAVILGFAIIHD